MASLPQFNPARLRSYIFRLPLFTRLLVLVIVLAWAATIPFSWFRPLTALEPEKVNPLTGGMYRLNTFPLMHINFLHMMFNVITLTPLLERFEAEFGTIPCLLLFTGPFGLLPGGLYVLLERFVLRSNTTVMGASIWVFMLLCAETVKTHKANPNFSIGPYKIPTWTTPILAIFITYFIVPSTSLLGHLCGALFGYLWGLGYIRFLAPPEKILRWVETKLNLLGRLPHYVSIDQKKYGRYGILPSVTTAPRSPVPETRPT
ncbi:hypothetical protein GQ43DRAFT_444046 [Delitschia confertaspora ATCC 74209]|uniref:rhomboid protease n=1 Tax=Delitschia confertaspora ATCC 74209 TaxID=1513339 RepID=A0A9P4MLY3_9PLEO|nr:hypothetical protein GQ43DRAFT_444046 [Delitschia confertaspora ATCC 74209]